MNPTRVEWFFGRSAALGTLVWALAGCTMLREEGIISSGPAYQPTNVHVADGTLPQSLKRVVVLPLVVSEGTSQPDHVRSSLEPVLVDELIKSGRFEVVRVSPGDVRQWTGRSEWTTADSLPANFFDTLRTQTGCDGVLMAQVTTYRPYPPVAIGWRWQLIDTEGPTVWWAVDEVFDANEAPVANGARNYHFSHTTKSRSMTDSAEILNSPLRFARYSASVLVATCPGR